MSSFHFYRWNQFKVVTYTLCKKPPQIFCDVGHELTAYGT